MAGRSFLYGGASGAGSGGTVLNSALLTNKRVPCSSSSSKPLDSFFISGSSPSLLGSRSIFSFDDGGNGSGRPFFQSFDQEDNGDDDYDEYFRQPEKKRRLKADQVQFLEKSFETENKLEPERKIQLAKELGLQPRQIAIWFQNRRARWKTKQLEKDYDVLQENYNKLKASYENLLKEQEILKSEVHDLSDKLLREKGTSDSSSTKSLSETLQQEQIVDCACEEDVSEDMNLAYMQDDNVAVKSVVLDSDSPHYTDGVHSSLVERGDSSYIFEQEQSDGSLDEEEDNLRKILPSFNCIFPKIETTDYPDEPAVNSCYFGFPSDDQSFGFWAPY